MFHSVNADFVRKNRPIPSDSCFSNLFKPTKTRHDSLWLTSTIKSWQRIWGRFWSSNNRLFQTHSNSTESYIQMMQTRESICEKWFRNLNLPSICDIYIKRYLRKPLTDWSCSIFVIFWNTNRCSRVHAPAAPCRGLTYRRNRTECVVWVNGTFVHFRAFVATPKKKSVVFFPHQTGPWKLAQTARLLIFRHGKIERIPWRHPQNGSLPEIDSSYLPGSYTKRYNQGGLSVFRGYSWIFTQST